MGIGGSICCMMHSEFGHELWVTRLVVDLWEVGDVVAWPVVPLKSLNRKHMEQNTEVSAQL
jgi:hypothetical protein